MKTITERQGYEAMLLFLESYLSRTGSKDITDVLSGGEYTEVDEPAESDFWFFWEEAINKVLKGNQPLRKQRL